MPKSETNSPAGPAAVGAGRNESRRSRRRTAACALLLLAVCAILFVPRTASIPLADPDEARAAIIVRHMLQSRQWLIPYKSERPWLDKPAPYYWLAAVGTVLTGDLELGGRAVSAVFATAAVLAAFALARRAEGHLAGLLAGLILATGAGFFFVARLYRMDMPFVSLMWLALWWFWRYEGSIAGRAHGGAGRWLGFYGFCAAATLVKGPAGLVLPGLVVGLYLLLSGRWRRVFELFNIPGILLFVLIAAPWYVAATMRLPEYTRQFLLVHNLVRFAGQAIEDKQFPGIYYIPIILGGMLPWTIYLGGAAARTFPPSWSRRTNSPVALFGWLAVLVPLALFMASKTKLELYILPVAPPLAVLIAIPLANWARSSRPDRLYHVGAVAMAVAVGAMVVAMAVFELVAGWLDAWILLPVGLVAGCVAAAGLAERRGRRVSYLGWTATAACVTLMFGAFHAGPRGFAARSCHQFGNALKGRLADDALLCYFGPRRYSFPLYAGRRGAVRFVEHWPADRRRLMALLDGPRSVYCLVKGSDRVVGVRKNCAAGLTVLGHNDKFFLITNAAAEAASGGPTATGDGRLVWSRRRGSGGVLRPAGLGHP